MILLSFKAVYEPDKGNKIWIKKLYSKGNLLYLLSYALRAYYSPIKSENMEIRKNPDRSLTRRVSFHTVFLPHLLSLR